MDVSDWANELVIHIDVLACKRKYYCAILNALRFDCGIWLQFECSSVWLMLSWMYEMFINCIIYERCKFPKTERENKWLFIASTHTHCCCDEYEWKVIDKLQRTLIQWHMILLKIHCISCSQFDIQTHFSLIHRYKHYSTHLNGRVLKVASFEFERWGCCGERSWTWRLWKLGWSLQRKQQGLSPLALDILRVGEKAVRTVSPPGHKGLGRKLLGLCHPLDVLRVGEKAVRTVSPPGRTEGWGESC